VAALLALTALSGCDTEPWEVVATQAIPNGAVRVWALSGRLAQGSNPILVDVVGRRRRGPPSRPG